MKIFWSTDGAVPWVKEIFRQIKLIFFIGCLSAMTGLAIGQQPKVSGTVVDQNSQPLFGVTVAEKGTTNGTITDADGKFTLSVAEGRTLSFSMIGFTTQEIIVSGTAPIHVVLAEKLVSIEEVVIVGYGSVKKKDLTTSVATVSTEDIRERPIISAASAIQGKAAGVTVMQPSGEPGAGLVVRVRGNSSISASNDPLYVVDGVPMTEINFLSPNDIESMQILKDASSAAIYGSRASNGVVLITTKMGSKGQAIISFNAHSGVTRVVKHLKSLNTAQYKTLMDEIGAVTLPDGLTDQTDWFKETFRTGVTQDYQLSISNSTDKIKYFVSGGMTDESGVIKVAYYKRYNLRANLENQIRSWLKFNTNLAYSDYSNNGIISGTGANRAGVILSVINTPTYAPIWNPAIPTHYYDNFYGAQVTHPVENMSRSENNKTYNNRFVGSGSGEITFFPALKLKSSLSLDRVYYNATSFLDPIKTSWGRTNYGQATDDRSLSSIMVFDNIVTYDKSFDQHNLSAMGGTSYTTSKWNQSYMTASHFGTSDILTLNAGNKIEQWSGTSASDWAIMSYLGRIAYNYQSKYLLTVNFRADGSSKLAPGHKWGYFPSVSAAWRISAEDFMKDIEWVTDLKLRGGWGKTGNQSGIGDYSYLQRYNINRLAWWDKSGLYTDAVPSLSIANMKNTDLTWETTTQSNIGIDLSAFKSRVILTLDAYYKYTTNLLMDVPLPSTAPVGSLTRNEGEMSNRGIEMDINSKNFIGKFKWESDFNISFNKNRLEKLTLQQKYYFAQSSTGENIVLMTPGEPLGVFYGYISKGVDPETGNLIYETKNADGVPSLSDRTIIGDPNPKFTYGFTNNFTYLGFTLNIFLQGSYGNDIYNISRMETEGMYDAKNQSVDVLDRWERPGMYTYMPRAVATKENLLTSTRFVEDGSYLRLKTLTLSYNFAGEWLKKINITRLQLYFTAQNLLTLTKYKGFDPEVSQYGNSQNREESAIIQGIDYGTYPQSKSYVIGLNVEF
ncbi:MAG TPA: TonB-dependent receptor [Prolixibacteraceae bacterium]|jgi:TonB-linked SusC/RagA family outer membrane protein